MKLLPDECVTRFVKRDLSEHEVLTVDEAGLKGLKNGELLQAAAINFDVFVTVDKNIRHQQNVKKLPIAILILIAKSNAYASLKPLIPAVLEALKQVKPGEIVRVEAQGNLTSA